LSRFVETRSRRDRAAFEAYTPPTLPADSPALSARPVLAGDPLANLPPSACARLADLRQTARDARAVADAMLDDVTFAREAVQRAEVHRRRIVDDLQIRRAGADHPSIRLSDSDIARARDDLADKQKRHDSRVARWREAAAIVDALEKYVRQRVGSAVKEFVGTLPPITPRRGQSALDVLDARREAVARLMADLAAARDAPRTKAEAKAAALAELDALAAQGEPDLSRLSHRDGAITWPTTNAGPQTVRIDGAFGVYQPPASSQVSPFDVWLHRDTLAKRLSAAIDAHPEAPGAMSTNTRADAIERLERELLAAERLEAQAVNECAATGAPTSHRHDADPRAVLGLADDAPKPA
jgi:hypothetical protein